MRKVVLLLFIPLLFLLNVAAKDDFLDPEEAFKPKIVELKDKLVFEVELGKNIYLYNDKLKVFISKPIRKEVTKDALIPKPVQYQKWIVNFGDPSVKVEISKDILQKAANSSNYEVEFQFQGCTTAGLCYMPMKERIEIGKDIPKSETKKEVQEIKQIELNESDFIASILKNKSTLLVLATFFGFGVLLSLTPCIFPMIPILSSIIVKANGNKEPSIKRGLFLSFLYVFSMSLAYAIAGVIAGLFGANLQVALQNPYALAFFSLIFVALSLSMFGYFRLELPPWIQNKIYKTTNHKEKNGVVGILVMGFLSALIVGPCVAPPLAGALIYIGQTGDALLGGLALFFMSLGMGLPLLAIGAGASKFMPKAGGWMVCVSKIFGIVMLGVAIWMLQRVIGDYTLYLWAFLFIGTSLYLYREFNKFLFMSTVSLIILIFGVFTFVGALSGANSLSKPFEKFTQGKIATNQIGLKWGYVKNINELNSALSSSKKPVMLYFTAKWCAICKVLDEETFQNPKVSSKLESEFTLLKVDVTQSSSDDMALQKKFGVFGPPAIIFYDKGKNEIKSAQMVGFKNADDFLEHLKKFYN